MCRDHPYEVPKGSTDHCFCYTRCSSFLCVRVRLKFLQFVTGGGSSVPWTIGEDQSGGSL